MIGKKMRSKEKKSPLDNIANAFPSLSFQREWNFTFTELSFPPYASFALLFHSLLYWSTLWEQNMKIENNLRDLNQIILLDSIVCPEKQLEKY